MGDHLMSLIKANDIQNASGGIPTVKSQQLIPTAWVNFNGTGTVAIRDSEGVSSITDYNVGIYDINYTTALANTNYAVYASSSQSGADGTSAILNYAAGGASGNATSAAGIKIQNSSGTRNDTNAIYVLVMGGQS